MEKLDNTPLDVAGTRPALVKWIGVPMGIVVFIIFGWLNNLVVGRWYESTRKSS